MEALNFLKENRRMCKSYTACVGCPLENTRCNIPDSTDETIQEIIRVTEQWSKEHPVITNAKKFEEIFGIKPENAEMPYKDRSFPNWWDQPFEGGK